MSTRLKVAAGLGVLVAYLWYFDDPVGQKKKQDEFDARSVANLVAQMEGETAACLARRKLGVAKDGYEICDETMTRQQRINFAKSIVSKAAPLTY